MKRSWAAFACAAVLVTGAAAVYAENRSSFTIDPSEMKEGETKNYSDDGTNITVRREGNATVIRIDSADKTDHLTISREGGRIRIGHAAGDGEGFVISPNNRRRIVIDGTDIDKMPQFRRFADPSSTYVCPKDHSMLRVPDGDDKEKTYKCPVDGTTMERRKGRGLEFLFDIVPSIEL